MIQLSSIKVSNFKCFSDEAEIELGKLTLLTGANSTGKSSLMYSVLGAMQSSRFPYDYSVNGRYVNMGNFSEMVFNHDNSLPINISFTLSVDSSNIDIKTTWVNSNISEQAVLSQYEAHSKDFDFILHPKKGGTDSEYLLDLDFRPQQGMTFKGHGLELFVSNLLRAAELYKTDYHNKKDVSSDITAAFEKRTNKKNILVQIKNNTITCPGDIQATIAYGVVNQIISEALRDFRNKMNFISSYRLAAERTYLEESLENGKIQASGKGFVNQLLSWREGDRQNYEALIDVMRSMGILYDIEPKRIGGGQFRVGVTIHKDGPQALLSDVGFGISQFLPIIVGDIELGAESTLFAAQPEIHLHPNAQANYADYLVRQINNKKNYIVETHSEYLLNRIRLAIVKGKLKEEDVRVYYLSQKRDVSKINQIYFTRSGQIIGAPEDFFETYMLDVMDIAMEAVGDEA